MASNELRKALNEATAVESLILLPLIKRVNEARNELVELRMAREEDEGEKKS